MLKKYPKKIQEAIERGDLIPREEVWRRYSKKEREAIEERARYLKAAMELRRVRKRLNLSQKELAQKMSVKREFISRVESGKQNVTLETLYRIAEATGRSLKLSFR